MSRYVVGNSVICLMASLPPLRDAVIPGPGVFLADVDTGWTPMVRETPGCATTDPRDCEDYDLPSEMGQWDASLHGPHPPLRHGDPVLGCFKRTSSAPQDTLFLWCTED